MKNLLKLAFLILLLLFNRNVSYSDVVSGKVQKNVTKSQHRVIDANTKKPVQFALIRIPTINYETKTDADGYFKLNADITATSIMSVEKQGYRPFSITINEINTSKPIIIGIEKTQFADLSLEADIFHLGDNKFSSASANSSDFQLKSLGPYYTKAFNIPKISTTENAYLVVGSVIGVDTLLARQMGQSNVPSAYSSPATIYFNGQKIAEIKYNSDGQQILLPKQLIKQNQKNEITIKTGKNLFQNAYIDYDDIEIANLHIEFKPVLANEN